MDLLLLQISLSLPSPLSALPSSNSCFYSADAAYTISDTISSETFLISPFQLCPASPVAYYFHSLFVSRCHCRARGCFSGIVVLASVKLSCKHKTGNNFSYIVHRTFNNPEEKLHNCCARQTVDAPPFKDWWLVYNSVLVWRFPIAQYVEPFSVLAYTCIAVFVICRCVSPHGTRFCLLSQ